MRPLYPACSASAPACCYLQVKELSLEEAIELDGQDDMWLLALYSPGVNAV